MAQHLILRTSRARFTRLSDVRPPIIMRTDVRPDECVRARTVRLKNAERDVLVTSESLDGGTAAAAIRI